MRPEPAPLVGSVSARSCWRLLAFGAITVHEIARCAAASPFPPARQVRGDHALQRWSARLLRSLGVEVAYSGTPPGPGVLLVANHRSYIDIAVIASAVPCSFLSKAEIADWPILGYGARRFANLVFVDRDDPLSRKRSRSGVADILKQGVSVVVFPEGTTSAGPGVLPFRPGIFRMAAALEIPVAPVAVRYEDPRVAWVGNDTFLGHFLSTFSQRTLRAAVDFGPLLRGRDAESLRSQAWVWVSRSADGQEPGGLETNVPLRKTGG